MNITASKQAVEVLRERFECFTRNGRWGTCVSCPRSGDGQVLPELCQFTERGDHTLTLDGLVEQYKREYEAAR